MTVHLNSTRRSRFLCIMVGRTFGSSKDPVDALSAFLARLTIVRDAIMLDNQAVWQSMPELGESEEQP